MPAPSQRAPLLERRSLRPSRQSGGAGRRVRAAACPAHPFHLCAEAKAHSVPSRPPRIVFLCPFLYKERGGLPGVPPGVPGRGGVLGNQDDLMGDLAGEPGWRGWRRRLGGRERGIDKSGGVDIMSMGGTSHKKNLYVSDCGGLDYGDCWLW